jgi:hypothetical protein
MNKKFFYFLTISFLISNNAHAYLDPGTTGIIFSTIVGIIVAGIAYIKNIISKIKTLISRLSGKKSKINEDKKN